MEEYLTFLMNSYGDSVFRMCYAYLKDYQLAEDVAQETFIRVYQHYGEFHNQSSIKTWIIQIAINLCKNQMRTHWWKNRVHQMFMDVEEEADHYDSILNGQLILEEISKLSVKYREVILLYYYQELTISEIAKILDVKESTIKARLVRAREKLKPRLREVLWGE
ncbi:MAG: sigma-70 family RNA polymerase sigma factor [Lachnospiraceae bacterium]|nr:sigma-70 family RNA polymerase sigma factor [Lachnospiraceae bacterium]